jgi:hypothetical protein
MKNGCIFAINGQNEIKYIKSFFVNSLYLDNKKNNNKEKKTFNFSKFKIFASQEMDKIIISNEFLVGIWSKNEIKSITSKSKITSNLNNETKGNNNSKDKDKDKDNDIEELNGTFYNISLEKEKKDLMKNNTIINKDKDNNNKDKIYITENLTCAFGTNYYLGSFGRMLYLLITPTEIKGTFKIIFVDYLFLYEKNNKIKINQLEETKSKNEKRKNEYLNDSKINENIRQIEKKVINSYINYTMDPSFLSEYQENIQKDYIIMRYNNQSNICAIVINSINPINSYLFFFFNETYKITSFNLVEISNKYNMPLVKDKENKINLLWVEDIEWICNDTLLVILFSKGYCSIVNLSFQCLSVLDISNSLITEGINSSNIGISNNSNKFSFCPVNLYEKKNKIF